MLKNESSDIKLKKFFSYETFSIVLLFIKV